MPSPDILDFKKLLAPVAGDKPTGVDLRSDPALRDKYYLIKDARTKARTAERQLMSGEELEPDKLPDWKPVLEHGTDALGTKTKDIEITAFVIEALVRRQGFAGLRDGFRLARELIERYWDTLYPLPNEEDGVEGRVAALTGLNGADSEGTLIAPIGRVPLTVHTSVGELSAMHYQEAMALSKITDAKLREKKLAQGAKSVEIFQKAMGETPTDFLVKLHDDLKQCQDEFAKLGTVLTQKCGANQAPPTSSIRAALENCLEVLKATAGSKLTLAPKEEKPAEEGKPAEAKAAKGPASAAPGETLDAIRTREDAFKALLKVADYFRRTEPHTIVSFALEQVVRWGRMPLPELLTELIPEDAQRKILFKQVGIPVAAGPPPKAEPAKK